MSDNLLLPAKRRPGRPRKVVGELAPLPEKKKKPMLPLLMIDVNRDPELPILGVTEKHQSLHLGWSVAEVRSVTSYLGLYSSLPMLCQASGCYYAPLCPTKPDFKFKGKLCPLQTLDIYRWFVGYINDLEIKPTDYVDLTLVADLIRIDLQLKIADQQIQMSGMEVDTVGGVIQSTGVKGSGGAPIWEKTAHPLLLSQDKLRNRRRELHKALIASRDMKLDRDRKEGKIRDNELDIFERFRALNETRSATSVSEVVDADYEVDDE